MEGYVQESDTLHMERVKKYIKKIYLESFIF